MLKLGTRVYYMNTHCSLMVKFENSEQFRIK